MENLWPTKADIFFSEEGSPKKILEEQVNLFNQEFNEIRAEILSESSFSEIDLSNLQIHTSSNSIKNSAYMNMGAPIYHRLIILSVLGNYRIEILRIKQYPSNNYPSEIIDCINDNNHIVNTKEELNSVLKTIFHSDRVKTTLRNILKLYKGI